LANDVRFLNEAKPLKNLDAVLIRLERSSAGGTGGIPEPYPKPNWISGRVGKCDRQQRRTLFFTHQARPDCWWRMMANHHRGRVNFLDRKKGFGFIRRETGRDVFVHRNHILSGDRNLEPGEKVEFAVRHMPRGPAAVDVGRVG